MWAAEDDRDILTAVEVLQEAAKAGKGTHSSSGGRYATGHDSPQMRG